MSIDHRDASLELTLTEREQQRRDALIADDMMTFAELLADDLVHVHTTGIVHGKADLLKHAGSFLQFINVERGELKIQPLGSNAAVMTGTMTNTVKRRDLDERVTVQAFVTQIWVRAESDWKISRFHATRLPQE